MSGDVKEFSPSPSTLEQLSAELAKECASLPAALQSTHPVQFVDFLATVFKDTDDRPSSRSLRRESAQSADGLHTFAQALKAVIRPEEAKAKASKLRAIAQSVIEDLTAIHKTSFPPKTEISHSVRNGLNGRLNIVSCNACNKTVLAHSFAAHLTVCTGQDHSASPAPSRTSRKEELTKLKKNSQNRPRKSRGSAGLAGALGKSRFSRSTSDSQLDFDAAGQALAATEKSSLLTAAPPSSAVQASNCLSCLDDEEFQIPQGKRSLPPRKRRKVNVSELFWHLPPFQPVQDECEPPKPSQAKTSRAAEGLPHLSSWQSSQTVYSSPHGLNVPVHVEGSPEHINGPLAGLLPSHLVQPPGGLAAPITPSAPNPAGMTAHARRILAAKAKSATVKPEQPPALANSCGPRLAPRLSSQGMIKQSLAARPPKTVGATGHSPAFPTQPLPAGTSAPKSIAQPLVQNPLVPRKVPMHVERARAAALQKQQAMQNGQVRPQTPQAQAAQIRGPNTAHPVASSGAGVGRMASAAIGQPVVGRRPLGVQPGGQKSGVASGQRLEQMAAARQVSSQSARQTSLKQPAEGLVRSNAMQEGPKLNLMDFMYPSMPQRAQPEQSIRPQPGVAGNGMPCPQAYQPVTSLRPQHRAYGMVSGPTAMGWPQTNLVPTASNATLSKQVPVSTHSQAAPHALNQPSRQAGYPASQGRTSLPGLPPGSALPNAAFNNPGRMQYPQAQLRGRQAAATGGTLPPGPAASLPTQTALPSHNRGRVQNPVPGYSLSRQPGYSQIPSTHQYSLSAVPQPAFNPNSSAQNRSLGGHPVSKVSSSQQTTPAMTSPLVAQGIPGLGEEAQADRGQPGVSQPQSSVPDGDSGFFWGQPMPSDQGLLSSSFQSDLDGDDSLLYTTSISGNEDWRLGFGSPLANPASSAAQNWMPVDNLR